jgi:hypothetical protein
MIPEENKQPETPEQNPPVSPVVQAAMTSANAYNAEQQKAELEATPEHDSTRAWRIESILINIFAVIIILVYGALIFLTLGLGAVTGQPLSTTATIALVLHGIPLLLGFLLLAKVNFARIVIVIFQGLNVLFALYPLAIAAFSTVPLPAGSISWANILVPIGIIIFLSLPRIKRHF